MKLALSINQNQQNPFITLNATVFEVYRQC